MLDKTLTLRKSMYMRACGASELRNCAFHILELCIIFFNILLVLQICCRTYDILVGLHVPTNIQLYRQNSEKALGGGAISPCPPPPLWLR